MSTELANKEPFQITLPGVNLSGNRLKVLRELTPEETQQTLFDLRSMDDSAKFWAGDFLSYIKHSRSAKELSEGKAAEEADKMGDDAARIAASVFSDPMGIFESMRVSELLNGQRYTNSYAHHREALAECGNNSVEALKWIERAKENDWSIPEMRKAIRLSRELNARGNDDKGIPTLTGPVNKLSRTLVGMFRMTPVEDMSLDEVSYLMDEISPVEEQIQRIKSRWLHFNPELRA